MRKKNKQNKDEPKDVSYIDDTLIYFNLKLKNFIKKFKIENIELISQLRSENSVEGFIYVQQKLRDLFQENTHFIDLKNAKDGYKLDYYDNFALMLCLVCDLSKCNDWCDIEKQYDLMRDNNGLERDTFNENQLNLCDLENYEKKTINCCCGHWVYGFNTSILTNPYTNLSLLIACHCLKKICSDKSKEVKKCFEKEQRKNIVYVRLIIENEKKNFINNEAKKKRELEEKIKKENRECKSCKKYCIPINEVEWKLTCYNCYTLTGKCFIKLKKI